MSSTVWVATRGITSVSSEVPCYEIPPEFYGIFWNFAGFNLRNSVTQNFIFRGIPYGRDSTELRRYGILTEFRWNSFTKK